MRKKGIAIVSVRNRKRMIIRAYVRDAGCTITLPSTIEYCRKQTMRRGFKRWLVPLLLGSAFAMFLPGTPWSDRVRHTLKKATFNTEMRLAKWRGIEPR